MTKRLPSLFIGSSVEGLSIARKLQIGLEYDCEVTIWNQGVFGLGQGTLESLVRMLDRFDFAILVLTPDDLVHSRDRSAVQAPRDNVLFELGLFMGGLGRDRTFVLHDRTAPIKIPSDLAGVTTLTFAPHSSGNLDAALGSVTARVADVVSHLGRRTPPPHQVTPPRRIIGTPPTILVTGGRDPSFGLAFDAAFELGRLLGERDVKLLSGVAQGVDEYFCRGVSEASAARGADVKRMLTCYAGKGQQPSHRFGRIVQSRFRSRQEGIPELICECDIAITFGGGRNTSYIGVLALLEDRALLPASATGGASSELHDLVLSKFDTLYGGRIERDSFVDLADINRSAIDIAKLCIRLVDSLSMSV
jgi:hypothetical protein